MKERRREFYESPVGRLMIEEEGGVLKRVELRGEGEEQPSDLTHRVRAWLEAYFKGQNSSIDFPIEGDGTPFQKCVWRVLREIPYGKVVTYGDIARHVMTGDQNPPFRAVGQAVGRNPILIIVPCHRVVASSSIGGFSAGLFVKRKLLETEGILL